MKTADFPALGEKLTRALIDGNFELYESIIHLPLRVAPRDGDPYVLNTVEELKVNFGKYCAAIQANNVTDIFRRPISITELAEDWIEVTVEMHVLSQSGRIVDPFRSQFVLRPQGGEWRIAIIRSSLGYISWTLGRIKIDDDRQFGDL